MFLSAIWHIIHRHLVVWCTLLNVCSRFVNGDISFRGGNGLKNGIDIFQLAQTADKEKKVSPIKTPSQAHLD